MFFLLNVLINFALILFYLFLSCLIVYCATYYNPYELYVKGEKVFGFALKKTRTTFIFQGVLHCSSSLPYFQDVSDSCGSYFTKGLSLTIDYSLFFDTIFQQFKK